MEETNAKKHPFFGSTFVPLQGGDAATTFKLGSLKVENGNLDDDNFQILDPNTLDAAHTYAYLTKEFADIIAEDDPGSCDYLIGWWDVGADGFDIEDDKYRADNVDIPVGSAFLGLCLSGEDIRLTSAGQVPEAARPISTDAKKYPSFSNYVPRTIKLGWIQVENGNLDDDNFQILDPDTLDAAHTYAYLTKEFADIIAEDDPGSCDYLIGWWDVGADGFDIEDDKFRADNVDIPAGTAFLGLCLSGENITLTIPGSFYNGEAK